jgi:DNA modification methylase
MTALVARADARTLPLPDESVDLIVTSPPYHALRDYRDGDASLAGQIGAEPTPQEYVAALLDCTRECVRVLKPSGSIFVNLGDKYAGGGQGGNVGGNLQGGPHLNRTTTAARSIPLGARVKSLLGLPWRYALGCIDDLGLTLRAEIIWSKANGMPESVSDRARRSHEQFFHFTRQPRYYSAVDEIRTPVSDYARPRNYTRTAPPGPHRIKTYADTVNPLGALPGSVWEIATQPFIPPVHIAHARCCGGRDPECDKGLSHYAAFPPALVRRIVLGWSPPGICAECGEGRRPLVERPGLLGGDNNPDSRNGSRRRSTMDGGAREWALRAARPDRITGHGCACPTPDAPTRPAIVVDPFGGTGCTALVASVHGRVGLSFDLSHDYGRLAKWRTSDPGERARALGVPKPPPVSPEQGSLFDGLDGVVA